MAGVLDRICQLLSLGLTLIEEKLWVDLKYVALGRKIGREEDDDLRYRSGGCLFGNDLLR